MRFAEAGHPARAPLVEGNAGDALERADVIRAMDADELTRAERGAEVLREGVGEDVEAAALALRQIGRLAVEPCRGHRSAAGAFENVAGLRVDAIILLAQHWRVVTAVRRRDGRGHPRREPFLEPHGAAVADD